MEKKHESRLSLKVSKDNLWLIEALKKEAAKQNRTTNNLIVTILVNHFNNEKN